MRSFLTFASIFVLFYVAHGYSGGAPVEVCDDMTPQHPYKAQNSSFPFVVSVDKEGVKAGQKLQITISGGKEDPEFKGFLVQVRSSDKAIGSFDIPEDDRIAKTITCHGFSNSSATHKTSLPKEDVVLDWVAPKRFRGKLNVYVTVAKDGKTYWVQKRTAEINVV